MLIKPIPCPGCKQQYTSVSSRGQTLYKSRLGVCDNFKNMLVVERAELIAQTSGCVLCLD